MIKRTLAGFACVLLALALSFGGETYLRFSAEKLLSACTVAEDAPDAEVLSAANSAAGEWDARQRLLGVVVKHSDADALGKLFVLLRAHAGAGDVPACRETLLRCRAEVGTLLEGERFSWENVLLVRPCGGAGTL